MEVDIERIKFHPGVVEHSNSIAQEEEVGRSLWVPEQEELHWDQVSKSNKQKTKRITCEESSGMVAHTCNTNTWEELVHLTSYQDS